MFARPGDCYVPISQEGINLEIYYSRIPSADMVPNDLDPEDDGNWYDFDLNMIDKEFYVNNGISISELTKLGVRATVVNEGIVKQEGVGDGHWIAVGEYCPYIEIDGLKYNLEYISLYPEEELAQRKSVEILKLLLAIAPKLQGHRRYRKNNPYEGELEDTRTLKYNIRYYEWLYDKAMNTLRIRDLSRYDLNIGLYGNVLPDKTPYEILGFIEKDVDSAEDTLQKAQSLNRQDKIRLLRMLAEELGQQIFDLKDNDDDWEDDDDVFKPGDYQDNDFPVNKINNIEYLIRHVQEQFFCADPTKYQKVWRQIRVSKNSKADRSYAIGMYTNSSNTKICQICKQPVAFIEVDQIANFGIEMPQLNLCLCRDCSAKYKAMRDGNKDEFKKQIRVAIMAMDINEYSDDYSIVFNEDTVLHFTQSHLAEIQEILRLLAEYGNPSEEVKDYDDNVSGPLMHRVTNTNDEMIPAEKPRTLCNLGITPRIVVKDCVEEEDDIAKSGCFITYKNRFSNDDISENILQPEKFPLHKALVGHKVGDIVVFMGKEYEIIGIL